MARRSWPVGIALGVLAIALTSRPAPPASQVAQPFCTLSISALTEASGLAPSWIRPGVYWSHNDSPGDRADANLYAFDRTGKQVARANVQGAENHDWEDIASGPGAGGKPALFIGDIGDQGGARKGPYVLYRVPEPDPRAAPATVTPDRRWEIDFGRERPDFEALLVHPTSGRIYLVSKEKSSITRLEAAQYRATSTVYEIVTRGDGPAAEARAIGRVSLTATIRQSCMVTGGDFRRDGGAFVLRTYTEAFEFTVREGEEVRDALRRTPRQQVLPPEPQGEAICYTLDGKSWLTCSERLLGWSTVWQVPISR